MTTSNLTDTVTILQSAKPMAKAVVIGEDGVPVVGRAKMEFLFDVTERSLSGLSDLHDLLQQLQHGRTAIA
jgi:hypothetical protein